MLIAVNLSVDNVGFSNFAKLECSSYSSYSRLLVVTENYPYNEKKKKKKNPTD